VTYGQQIEPCFKPAPKPAEHITLSTEIAGHAHDYMQVVIGLKGSVDFDVSGVGNRIEPGQGCIVSPDSTHVFGGIDKPSDILVLNVTRDAQSSYPAINQVYQISESDCYFGMSSKTIQLIQMLAAEVHSSPDDLLLAQACSHTIIALLLKHICPFQTYSKIGRLDLDVVDRYIEKHIQNRISVNQLAGSVFLSESQFFNQFKKQTGVTPHQYLLVKRVEYAKRLIETSSFNLNYVSDITGFSGQSAFTHAFTKCEGISPSQYKKRYS